VQAPFALGLLSSVSVVFLSAEARRALANIARQVWSEMSNETTPTDPALLGVLALLAADRAERQPEPELPTELVLSAAGLDYRLIASILGKKPDAVRMKIARAKAAAKKGKPKK
jgi:DNA-directed RNA polymerase specialized sigma24 family protein